jgi:hypothetical protein
MNQDGLLDFKLLGEPLNKLLTALANKLSREWPARYRDVVGARELFVLYVRGAQQAYLSAFYLCGDLPEDPRRKLEFAVSLPPINRALVDNLFNLLFIMEDVPERCGWYFEANWKNSRLELDRLEAEYREIPEWQEWFGQMRNFVEMGNNFARLSAEQRSNPQALRSWPNIGGGWRYKLSPGEPLPPSRAFMKYLDDFFYIDLSQQSNLTPWGMIKRLGFLLDEVKEIEDTEATLRKYRNFQVATTVVLALAIATEIEVHFGYGLRQDCIFAWTVANKMFVIAEEMFRKRYRELLAV